MTAPLHSLLLPLTIPASWLYGAAIRVRNSRYDRGVGVEQLARPVISVGNLTTGGTGKTPMVRWIVALFEKLGGRPAIAMRGYGATRDQPSDELLEYQEQLPRTPVIADPNRLKACRRFIEEHARVSCFILDDGFQHRRIARDLDLVLVDATRPGLDDRLLPAGHLREPTNNLKRADGVIITRARAFDESLASRIERIHGRAPLAWTRHRWTGLEIYQGAPTPEVVAADWLHEKPLVTMLGVGNPAAVRKQIENAGAKIMADIPARDHEVFDRQKLEVARGLCHGMGGFVVTAKDWTKLRNMIDLSDWPAPIVVPRVEIEVFRGREELEAKLEHAAKLADKSHTPSPV